MNTPEPVILKPCPKGYNMDLDKAVSPRETLARVAAALQACGQDIVADVRRIDTGRLDIPVFIGMCGQDARRIMPTRKQMGKGSSVEQAKASALMEVMERYAFFSFWENRPLFVEATWNEARELFGEDLIDIAEILRSVNDSMPAADAVKLMTLIKWQFYPATHLQSGRIVWLPLDWFRMLGEFNGSSAGNTAEESILQGISELLERHVSCLVDRQKPTLPTIDPASCLDERLTALMLAFRKAGINLVLKDISLGMPMPTVAALAWDETTFPDTSEIVFTAGTASSPSKAAIRAITEVAQLGGDFCTNSRYEASGLSKFSSLDECSWLLGGPEVSLDSLPSIDNADIREEILSVLRGLQPIQIYGIDITNPALEIPAHYCIGPGLQFRERDANQSLGLYVGRKLAEEAAFEHAMHGLDLLEEILPNAHYTTFFRALAYLKNGDASMALQLFHKSISLQPDPESQAMANFYAGYSLTCMANWRDAMPYLEEACRLSPGMKEYVNLLGAGFYRLKRYAEAEQAFEKALSLDRGSAIDLANRGICRKFLGKTIEATADLEAALNLDPGLDFARGHLEELKRKGLDA